LFDDPQTVGGTALVASEPDIPPDNLHVYRICGGLACTARELLQENLGRRHSGVKSVSSGDMLRFTYRVLDPRQGKSSLSGQRAKLYLVDKSTGAKLFISGKWRR
jgi:hypothetical protein